MDSSFGPKGMEPKVVQLMYSGQYLGLRGAIASTLKRHFFGKQSSPEDLMVLMNVFYSAATNMWVSSAIYKPLAPIFLFLAKTCGVKAFKRQMGELLGLEQSLSILDVRSHYTAGGAIDFGGIQVLQSCFARWLQMKQKLHLSTFYEMSIVRECSRVLNRAHVPRTIHTLSSTIMIECVEEETEEWCSHQEIIFDFCQSFSDEVMEGEAEPAIVQTFIRASRVLGLHSNARKVALLYGLKDQAEKSK